MSSTSGGRPILKGFLYFILIVILVLIGFGLSYYIETTFEPVPVFMSYIPLFCYVAAGFVGILFLFNIINNVKKSRSFGSIYQQAGLLLILIFAFIPLLSPILDQGMNDHNFSIYNSYWTGSSEFKHALEEEGYEVMAIQSSLSATKRLDKSVLLVLLGPDKLYNPVFEIPFFIDFLQGDNSLLLCHDHGSTYELLWEIFSASMWTATYTNTSTMPVTIFPEGYLLDNASHAKNNLFPVIKKSQFVNDDGDESYLTRNVSQVVLSKASAAAGGPLIRQFGWDVVANSSGIYSYVDKNGDGRFNETEDSIDLSFIFDAIGQPDKELYLPLGGTLLTPTVFLKKDMGNFRIFVSSDASLWNNELIENKDYQNKQFAKNVVDWLTHQEENGTKSDWVVAIDESHIRPETSNDISSAGIFGYLMRYIIQLSTNPITAWIYPILAIYTMRKYLPKEKEEEEEEIEEQEKAEDKLRFRTSSFFAKKINWYHEKRKYRQALLLLYRRLERKLHAQLGDRKITPENVVTFIRAKETDITKVKLRRIAEFMEFITMLKSGEIDIYDKYEFEHYYYEMEWVLNNI